MRLIDHRIALSKNPQALIIDVERCYHTVVPHLKRSGYPKITYRRAENLIRQYVDAVFICQNRRPFFWIESKSKLPYCWNAPHNLGWTVDYIMYQWGHLNSLNQVGESAHCIENLCLQSARCNQHIQSSLNVDELTEYGGKLEEIIKANLERRRQLFASQLWLDLMAQLAVWR